MLLFLIFCISFFRTSAFPSDTPETPNIHEAIRNGNITMVKKILDENPSIVNSPDSSQCTPLHWAAFMGYNKITDLLITRGANLEARDKMKSTPLHVASIKRHEATARLLILRGAHINAKGLDDLTPLHFAAFRGLNSLVKFMVSKGADLTAKEVRGWTPLETAIKFRKNDTAKLIRELGGK